MPQTQHVEKHFMSSEMVRDIVIGMSDGLTVPFALAAGLSGAVTATNLVVIAGIAEIVAGSIAMGLGGYLAAKSDRDHYASERAREESEIVDMPEEEMREVAAVFQGYGLEDKHIEPLVNALRARPKAWVDFMMRFELGLDEPDPRRAPRSALTIALSYVLGGFIPLAPYILMRHITPALVTSAAATLVALFVFGIVKGRFTGVNPLRGGLQTVVIGGLAASAAFAMARWIG